MKFINKRQLFPTWENSGFTLNTLEVEAAKEIYFQDRFKSQSWNTIMSLQTGIKHDKRLMQVGNFNGLTARQRDACELTVNPYKIGGVNKTWTPKTLGDRHEDCKDDLMTSPWKLLLTKKGMDKYDLTGTDYAAMAVDRLSHFLSDDTMFRLILFSNTAIATGTGASNLTAGELDYFNMSAGMFSQMETVIASYPLRRVTITQNTGTLTYAGQKFAKATSAVQPVTTYFETAYAQATAEMKASADLQIICTRTIYDQYWDERNAVGSNAGNGEAWSRGETGDLARSGLRFRGIPVIPIDTIDRLIARHFDNGTYQNDPHKFVMIAKSNWSVGTEDEKALDSLEIEYNSWFKKMKIEYEFNIDQKIINDLNFVFGY